MIAKDPNLIAAAMQHFATQDPTPEEQTQIALFLQAIKGANATALSKIMLAPLEWLPFRFLHEQYFKELELMSLLTKSTSWCLNPAVYADATTFNFDFLQKTCIMEFMMAPVPPEKAALERAFYDYLALSHAFMSQIRFLPLFPANKSLDAPFFGAINEVEITNGRLIQTQIRLLKDLPTSLSVNDREAIIEKNGQLVSDHFMDLLRLLALPKEVAPKGAAAGDTKLK